MADLPLPEHPLDVLPAMLNLVLIQTGKIIRDPGLHNSSHIGLTRRKIGDVIPPAHERFHQALDEIEIEILQAKSVMERDLSLIKKRRAERERKAGILVSKDSVKELKTDFADVEGFGDQGIDSDSTGPAEADVPMLDGHPTAPDQIIEAVDLQQTAAAEKAVTTVEDMPQDADNSAGLAISIAPDSKPLYEALEGQPSSMEANDKPSAPDMSVGEEAKAGPPETLQAGQLDFESMFKDTDFTGGEATISFEDMDFSTDDINLDSLGESAFQDISMTNADIASVVPTTNEDINSLLPGLGNYVNGGTDAGDTNPVPTAPSTSIAQATTTATTAPATTRQPPVDSVIGDSSFDGFLSLVDASMDFSITEGNVAETGENGLVGDDNLGEFESFNEDWFKMDRN